MDRLDQAWLVDDYAMGRDTGLIDLLLVGDIDRANLADLVAKTERYIERRIRSMVVSPSDWNEFERILDDRPRLLLWNRAPKALKPHP